jgi:hypothetical protein
VRFEEWQPSPLPQELHEDDFLPPRYEGVDPIRFFKLFKSKTISIKKDEFETSSDFANRTSKIDDLLSPISSTELYAFRIPSISFRYDADGQYYSHDTSAYICYDLYISDRLSCEAKHVAKKSDSYLAMNGFGASFNVQRFRGNNYSLAISKKSPLLHTLFSSLPDTFDYSYVRKLYIPLEKARTLKGKTIAIMFVGQIAEAKLIHGHDIIISPTITNPNDMFYEDEAIPFDLKKVIYYVFETGEILEILNQ